MQLAPARDLGRARSSASLRRCVANCHRDLSCARGKSELTCGMRATATGQAVRKTKIRGGIPGISIQSNVEVEELNSRRGYGVRSAVTSRASRTTFLMPTLRRQDAS